MVVISMRRRSSLAIFSAAVVAGLGSVARAQFYTGADVSLLTFMQQEQALGHVPTFKDNGVAANGDQILYDAGANLFRLRVFVNPQTTYTTTNTGAIQTTAYDIALAQQIKTDDPSAKILLDFHYSDTWADPGRQTKPAAWVGDATLAALETDVTNNTTTTLNAFKTAGVMPDMVQIGNETTDGMLWQTGSSGAAAVGGRVLFQGVSYSGLGLTSNKPTQTQTNQSWANFGGLLNAAISGVRAAQGTGPRIPVALSIDSGDQNGNPQAFFANIQSSALGHVSDFDIEGVDYYPSTGNSQKSFAFLQSNLTTLANTNTNNGVNTNPAKKIMLLETNYPYSGTANAIPAWAATPAGQQAEFLAVRNLMTGLPGNDGEGALYWYPEAVFDSTYSSGWYDGGNNALFDSSGNAQTALSPTSGSFNVTGVITATWVKNQDADWNTAANWLGGAIPNGVGAEADLLAKISAPHTLTNNSAVTLGSLYFNNLNAYTLGGSGSLTMSAASGSTASVQVLGGSQTINLPITIASNTTFNVASGGGLTLTAPLTINAGKTLSITVQSSASISLTGSFHAAVLSLASGSVASLASHGVNPKSLVELDSLAFGGSTDNWLGKLDITNNDVVVHGGVAGDIANQLKSGHAAFWNGSSGIVSSSAAGDTQFLTTIGYRIGGPVFDGINTTSNDVLVKYTYYGDADLNGTVDGADYAQIDTGFGSQLTGWANGDFNYDGVVDGTDYSLIDNTFNQLNTPAATSLAIISASSAAVSVPEPTTLCLLGMAVFGSIGRRSRSIRT
jgi:arabinogalactan endo-1,4-beta-galactosidase